MCWFSVYCDFNAAVVFVVDFYVKKGYGPVYFLFMWEFNVSSTVNGVQVVCEFLCVSMFYFFQYVVYKTFPVSGSA